MSTPWTMTSPKELVRALRIGGNCYGQSGKLPRPLTLNKTDLIGDLMKLPEGHLCTWKIIGDADDTARYSHKRRGVVLWLGQ